MEDAIRRVNDLMDFPSSFAFRVIAASRSDLRAQVVCLVETCLSRPVSHVEEKTSAGGRWCTVRVRAQVESAEEVVSTYQALQGVEGLKLLL